MRIGACFPTAFGRFQDYISFRMDPVRKQLDIAIVCIFSFGSLVAYYQKIGLKIVKITLKIVVQTCAETAKKVERVIIGVALWSISLKLFFQIPSLYEKTKKFEKSLRTKNSGAIGWALLELAVKPFQILNSLLSLGNAVHKLVELNWLQLFQFAVTPLQIFCLSYRLFKRVHKICILILEYRELVLITEQKGLVEYLNQKIGTTTDEIERVEEEVNREWNVEFHAQKEQIQNEINQPIQKQGLFEERAQASFLEKVRTIEALKVSRLKRHVDKKIVSFMKEALAHLSQNRETISRQDKALILKDIKKLFLRRAMLDAGNALFIIAQVVAQIASEVFLLLNPLFFLVFSIAKTAFSTFKFLYMERKLGSGLHKSEFFPNWKIKNPN